MSTDRDAAAADLQRFLLETPATDVVAQHVMGLVELAALHLGRDEPDLGSARLAIDAADAIVAGLGDRLGPVHGTLRDTLVQLKLAAVQLAGPSGDG